MRHRKENRSLAQGKGYAIGDVSRIVDLSQKTIREYERMGLLRPRRAPRTNNRIYSDFEIEQIRQIIRLIHEEGLTLAGIQRLLQLAPCWNIFDCELKERCSAYAYPLRPCYEVRREKETMCSGSCEHCAVYINRCAKKVKLLEKEVRRNGPTSSRP